MLLYFPEDSARICNIDRLPYNPVSMPTVWALPLSLAATKGISFDFFSSAY